MRVMPPAQRVVKVSIPNAWMQHDVAAKMSLPQVLWEDSLLKNLVVCLSIIAGRVLGSVGMGANGDRIPRSKGQQKEGSTRPTQGQEDAVGVEPQNKYDYWFTGPLLPAAGE